MRKFRLEVEMDNAAFEDGADGTAELARILYKAARSLDTGKVPPFRLLDHNGNHVGNVEEVAEA